MAAIVRWMGFTPDWWRNPNQAAARRLKAYLDKVLKRGNNNVWSTKLTKRREEDASQPLSTFVNLSLYFFLCSTMLAPINNIINTTSDRLIFDKESCLAKIGH